MVATTVPVSKWHLVPKNRWGGRLPGSNPKDGTQLPGKGFYEVLSPRLPASLACGDQQTPTMRLSPALRSAGCLPGPPPWHLPFRTWWRSSGCSKVHPAALPGDSWL